MTRLVLAPLLLLTACSQNQGQEVPPLPPETAESTNALMTRAEQAAADARTPVEQAPSPARSSIQTNEVKP